MNIDLRRRNYNDRLFKSNYIRTYFHLARFNWVRDIIRKYNIRGKSVIEIGCFDGKVFEYLPLIPEKYKGYDANWEGGLEDAKIKFSGDNSKEFIFAESPFDINLEQNEKFSLGISIETFEHIPAKLVCPYLDLLSKHVEDYVIITVPNEIGIFFLLKSILKPSSEDLTKYSKRDIINISLGKTNYVTRDNHKGFDYNHLIYDIRKYFNIIEISPYPRIKFLPNFLSFGIGILCEPSKI